MKPPSHRPQMVCHLLKPCRTNSSSATYFHYLLLIKIISFFCQGPASCPSEDEGTWGAEKNLHWGTRATFDVCSQLWNAFFSCSKFRFLLWLHLTLRTFFFFDKRPSWLFLVQRFYGLLRTNCHCRWRYTQQIMWGTNFKMHSVISLEHQ